MTMTMDTATMTMDIATMSKTYYELHYILVMVDGVSKYLGESGRNLYGMGISKIIGTIVLKV